MDIDSTFEQKNLTRRALKIIRKGYRNNRKNPLSKERIEQINELMKAKGRKFYLAKPKKPRKPR